MKRGNEFVDGGNDSLGCKKVKFSNGVDESLEREKAEGERVSAEENNNGGSSADTVPGDPDGLDESNRRDIDVSNDSNFGIEKEKRDLVLDVNCPVCEAPDGGLEHTQGPVINEKEVEIIDIVSGGSEGGVESIGLTDGYNADNKQVEVGVQYEGNMMENVSLGLGVHRLDNAVGDSSNLVIDDGDKRYTCEEKGKGSVSENDFDDLDYELVGALLALKAGHPKPSSDYETDSDESSRSVSDHIEDVEVRQPEVPDANELAEIERQRAEEEALYREQRRKRLAIQELDDRRRMGRKHARIYDADEDGGAQSSGKKQQPPASSPLEQLGVSFGPFSDALKKVRERTSVRTADQLIEWRPLEENQSRSLSAIFVPSLLDLSLNALAESAEGIASLNLVPDNLRGRLSNILCNMGKMNGGIMKIFVEGCPTEIRVKNCSWLTDDQFQQSFGKFQTKDLRVLQLDLCGQCMLDFAFRATYSQSSNAFARLVIVSLRGASRFTDSGLKDLIRSAPALRSINLGQCALLTSDSINFIADSLGSNLLELYIDECIKIEPMLILPAFKKLRCLEVLSVADLLTVTDTFVCEIVKECGRNIRELNLANCSLLTDCSLKDIGSSCADLCSLNISNLDNLTDMAMEYLANGCRSLRTLKLCRNDFSDEAVAAFLESSGKSLTELSLNNIAEVGPNTAFSLAKSSRKLLGLDISWCRKITEEALGLIVDSCSLLKLLKVFGCKQITNVFLNGHSNRVVRIIGLTLGPVLDHMNLLEPEEVLLKYSSMPVYTEDQNLENNSCDSI